LDREEKNFKPDHDRNEKFLKPIVIGKIMFQDRLVTQPHDISRRKAMNFSCRIFHFPGPVAIGFEKK